MCSVSSLPLDNQTHHVVPHYSHFVAYERFFKALAESGVLLEVGFACKVVVALPAYVLVAASVALVAWTYRRNPTIHNVVGVVLGYLQSLKGGKNASLSHASTSFSS